MTNAIAYPSNGQSEDTRPGIETRQPVTFLSCRDRCARGQRHVSLYLAARLGGKGKMIYVPRELEEKARRRLDDGREAARLLEIVCEASLEVFLKERKTRRSGREG